MSDKLEKCVCGGVGEYGILHKDAQYMRFNDSFYIECHKCYCETPQYSTENEAATAWNTMQRALKSGWSSEVPTEEGHYLYFIPENGDTEPCSVYFYKKADHPAVFFRTTSFGFANEEIAKSRYSFPDGLWYRINYTDPPKD